MSNDPTALIVVLIGTLVVGLFVYGAYWAFRIEGAMMDRLYRSRAFWVGLVSALFALLISSNLIIGAVAPGDWYLSLLQFVIQFAGAAVTFACIDSAIRVARRSDPLNRDTLRWRTLRKVLWFVVIVTILGNFAGVVLGRTNFFSSPGGPEGSFVYGPFGNLLGLIALVVSRRRSKDLTLRTHMKWFGLFVFVVLVVTQDPIPKLPDARVIVEALLLPCAYFLYRAARSLVSVGQVSSGTGDGDLSSLKPSRSRVRQGTSTIDTNQRATTSASLSRPARASESSCRRRPPGLSPGSLRARPR